MIRALAAVVLLAALVGCGTTSVPPTAPPTVTVTYPPRTSTPAALALTPIAVRIPSIGAESSLVATGFNPDGTAEVPPVDQPGQASWLEPGVEPGDLGPAVILGHRSGRPAGSAVSVPGVFAQLPELVPGDQIEVDRSDGTTAVFRVESVESFPKNDFPTKRVWGDQDMPKLHLVTCGGDFDQSERSYSDNVVAFSALVEIRPTDE